MARPYEELIISIPNHPKPGVVFQDVTPAFADPDAFKAIIDDLARHFADRGVTKIMGAEARGFIIGAAVAYAMGAGFVPARKPGKLPRATLDESYELEYGTDVLQIHADALKPQDTVLIVDDLVATGGTAAAMARLVCASHARLAGLGFFMELEFLNPRASIAEATDAEVFTLVTIDSAQM